LHRNCKTVSDCGFLDSGSWRSPRHQSRPSARCVALHRLRRARRADGRRRPDRGPGAQFWQRV